MDDIDQKIIDLLKKDSRTSFVKIADAVELSETAVRKRIKNLQDNGIIKRFTVEIDEEQQTKAIAMIETQASMHTPEISQKFIEIEGVSYLFETTGEYDIIAVLSTTTIEELNRTLEKIRLTEGVIRTNTSLVLRSWF
ncbi:Lrp/AsnC family transcriptional regulator [Candidatus Borrarchaeum sp.]|uniref:Lrp/AsnC family transcriptional regulator n=1 Tax=Candidatus Borrarchaeum sp. TaxID=2846742 RepID=UPI00257CDC40|nr:Lrp/AsnC family transcriptional regulator [Candidatus Borrarchaeum sp.]